MLIVQVSWETKIVKSVELYSEDGLEMVTHWWGRWSVDGLEMAIHWCPRPSIIHGSGLLGDKVFKTVELYSEMVLKWSFIRGEGWSVDDLENGHSLVGRVC